MVVELSNTIISKIEEKGIMCAWNDNEDPQDRASNSSEEEDSLWKAFEDTHEKSLPSTNDYPYYPVNMNWRMP